MYLFQKNHIPFASTIASQPSSTGAASSGKGGASSGRGGASSVGNGGASSGKGGDVTVSKVGLAVVLGSLYCLLRLGGTVLGLLLSFLALYRRWSVPDFAVGHCRVVLYDVSTIKGEDD